MEIGPILMLITSISLLLAIVYAVFRYLRKKENEEFRKSMKVKRK